MPPRPTLVKQLNLGDRATMATKIFKITVLSWNRHNEKRKSSYKYTMIKNNFCHDARMNALPTPIKWMFLGVLLTCGDYNNETVMMTERQVNDLLNTKVGASNALDALQSLQLLTYEILENSLRLIELNRNELKGREGEKEPKPADLEPEVPPPPIFDLWNSLCGDLPKAKAMTKKRKALLNARLKEFPDIGGWREVITRLAQSDFCLGKNDRGWVATFDFLLQPDVWAKVLEGKYDNRDAQKPQAAKVDWMHEAQIIFQACRDHGFSSETIKPHVGEERVALLRKAGGPASLGQMPNNEFTIKALAGKLKAAHEIINQQGKGHA